MQYPRLLGLLLVIVITIVILAYNFQPFFKLNKGLSLSPSQPLPCSPTSCPPPPKCPPANAKFQKPTNNNNNNSIILVQNCSYPAVISSSTYDDSKPLIRVIPYPNNSPSPGEKKFRISSSFSACVKFQGENPASDRIYMNVVNFLERLGKMTVLEFPRKISQDSCSLNINIASAVEYPNVGTDESYNLVVSESGISIDSPTDIGSIHALTTLLQLLLFDDSNGPYFPEITITDKPKYTWRGILVDSSRHFIPVEVILRIINAMQASKLNVLHWHLTDDQGFRVESKVWPNLHLKGSNHLYYTQNQIKMVVEYALQRGIRVLPEFDVPSHVSSWLAGYPEYSAGRTITEVETRWGGFDPTLNPIKDQTYDFLQQFFTEMATLFPDQYFHSGGDENNGNQWKMNPEISEHLRKSQSNTHALHAQFVKRISKILKDIGKTMVGWDEINAGGLLSEEDAIIHVWRGRGETRKALDKNQKVVISDGYYIDWLRGTDSHYNHDISDGSFSDTNPNILGGEATMWAEYVSQDIVEMRIWPRTAAIAERFWSNEKRNEDLYERMDAFTLLLEEYGSDIISNREKMLRRLVQGRNKEALHVLSDTLVPPDGVARRNMRFRGGEYTTWTPLVRLADLAIVDPPIVRHFCKWVDDILGNKDKILKNLQVWNENHEQVTEILENSPSLRSSQPQILQLSQQLSDMAQIGLDLLNAIEKKNLGIINDEMGKWNAVLTAQPNFQELHTASGLPACFKKMIDNAQKDS